jgi:hypothetical protein
VEAIFLAALVLISGSLHGAARMGIEHAGEEPLDELERDVRPGAVIHELPRLTGQDEKG